jgi:hypothetical protein
MYATSLGATVNTGSTLIFPMESNLPFLWQSASVSVPRKPNLPARSWTTISGAMIPLGRLLSYATACAGWALGVVNPISGAYVNGGPRTDISTSWNVWAGLCSNGSDDDSDLFRLTHTWFTSKAVGFHSFAAFRATHRASIDGVLPLTAAQDGIHDHGGMTCPQPSTLRWNGGAWHPALPLAYNGDAVRFKGFEAAPGYLPYNGAYTWTYLNTTWSGDPTLLDPDVSHLMAMLSVLRGELAYHIHSYSSTASLVAAMDALPQRNTCAILASSDLYLTGTWTTNPAPVDGPNCAYAMIPVFTTNFPGTVVSGGSAYPGAVVMEYQVANPGLPFAAIMSNNMDYRSNTEGAVFTVRSLRPSAATAYVLSATYANYARLRRKPLPPTLAPSVPQATITDYVREAEERLKRELAAGSDAVAATMTPAATMALASPTLPPTDLISGSVPGTTQ